MMLYSFVVFLLFLEVSLAFKEPRGAKGRCYNDRRYCYKGKRCINSDGSSYCLCPSGWVGTHCDTQATGRCYNDRRYCYKGKRCINSDGSSYCLCPSGWVGTHCDTQETEMPCYSNPCQNGGTCTDSSSDSYTCSCSPGWLGEDCSVKISSCSSMPCQNGGLCTDAENSYICTCAEDWSGQDCTDFRGSFTNEYLLLIMWNHFYADEHPSYVYLTTNSSTTVQLSSSDSLDPALKAQIDRNVSFTSELKIVLPPELQGQILQKEAKAVRIKSSEPISVVLFDNDYHSSDDSSMILPTEKLSRTYMVVSTQPLRPRFPVYSSVFAIASLNDNTTVTIKFKLLNNSSPIAINGKNYSDLDTLEMSLNRLETFQVGHNTDLTGTTIESSQPVAVFSGNRCNMLPGSMTSCSHMMEQLPPTAEWENFFIVPADINSNGSLIRVLSAYNATITIIKGSQTITQDVITGIPYDINSTISETVVIESSNSPLMVTNFVRGNYVDANTGDPYMIVVPGYFSYKPQYKVVIPDGYPKNFITIMAFKDVAQSILINGQNVDPSMIIVQENVMIVGISYDVITLKVSPGSIEIKHSSPFGLVVNGYRSLDSYGFVGNIYDVGNYPVLG